MSKYRDELSRPNWHQISVAETSEDKLWTLRTRLRDRSIQVRAGSLRQIRHDLMEIMGEKITRVILYRVGVSIGKSSYIAEKNKLSNEEDFWAAMADFVQRRGWASSLSHKKTDGDLSYRIHLQDSALADEVMIDNPPVCDILRGILGGWLASFHNRPVMSVEEVQCIRWGAQHCVFQVKLA
jgi:predicted hydrocarbon binding protein